MPTGQSSRCWKERCRKSNCDGVWHQKQKALQASAATQNAGSGAGSHLSPNEASTDGLGAGNTVARIVPMRGQGYEVHNVCAECEGPLRAADGHWHTRRIYGDYGCEPICCKHVVACGGSLAERSDKDVVLSGKSKKSRVVKGIDARRETAVFDRQESYYDDIMEEQVSKTSQQNAKVAKAVKGKAEAKAKTPKAPRAKKESIPYVFKPLAKSFKGVAGKATMNGNLLKHVPLHAVEDGKTACGYSVTEKSKGLETYELNWAPVSGEKVTCARCLKNLAPKPIKEKAPKAEKAKKPTPISKGKAKKAAKSAAVAAAVSE